MNIIELAKEAGFTDYYPERLTRFAALVREQAYREDKSLTLGFEVTERKWVDLTDDEILKAIGAESYDEYSERGLANAILDANAVIAAFKAKQGENNV